jgi:hypothetical protein
LILLSVTYMKAKINYKRKTNFDLLTFLNYDNFLYFIISELNLIKKILIFIWPDFDQFMKYNQK